MRVTIRIVACAVLWTVAGYATAAVNIDKVTVEAGRVTIQGNTEESHGVVVRIDWHEKPIEWRSWGGGTVFEVVVEASNTISLGGGKTSHGFVVTVKHGASKTGGNTINVALTEGNPVVGTFAIRLKADLVTKDEVLTFADVTLKDGKKLPVSVRLEPKVVLANPPAMPTPGAVQDDPKADSLPAEAAVRPGTPQLSGDLTFTLVVQRALPVGPDYRGAISFVTGTTPWWPKAAWIHTPRSEDIERQVGQWLELQKIDASGDENCGLVGHGLVAAGMKAAFVDVTPEMIVKATHGLDPKSHEFSPAGQPVCFPLVFAFRTRGGSLGVLEIRGFSEDRKLVRFRYKLVRPDDRGKTAAPPPPAALLAEIQRETIDETIHNLLVQTAAISAVRQPLGRPTVAYFERIGQEPRVAKVLKEIREGTPAQQEAVRAAILPECRKQEEAAWCDSLAGSLAAYAWQSFLDRMAADPQGQARLKPEQASALRAYQQYREATKTQGEFLYPSEMMRFAGEFVAPGPPPTHHEAEKVEPPVFESLLIEVSGFWPGRRTITIQGDGKYTFDMKDYRAAYQLKPEHVRQLRNSWKGTAWLTKAAVTRRRSCRPCRRRHYP